MIDVRLRCKMSINQYNEIGVVINSIISHLGSLPLCWFKSSEVRAHLCVFFSYNVVTTLALMKVIKSLDNTLLHACGWIFIWDRYVTAQQFLFRCIHAAELTLFFFIRYAFFLAPSFQLPLSVSLFILSMCKQLFPTLFSRLQIVVDVIVLFIFSLLFHLDISFRSLFVSQFYFELQSLSYHFAACICILSRVWVLFITAVIASQLIYLTCFATESNRTIRKTRQRAALFHLASFLREWNSEFQEEDFGHTIQKCCNSAILHLCSRFFSALFSRWYGIVLASAWMSEISTKSYWKSMHMAKIR